MKMGRRPPRKKDQALDVVASAAQTWSKWHLGKRAGEGVAKGAKKAAALKPGKPSPLKRLVTGTPARIAGAVALVGGLGAVLARKLKRGGDEPSYTPPAPHEPAAPPPPPPNPTAAAITHDAPPPPSLSAAPEPPASPPPPMPKPETSVSVEDLAADKEEEPATHEEPASAGEDDEPVDLADDDDKPGGDDDDAKTKAKDEPKS